MTATEARALSDKTIAEKEATCHATMMKDLEEYFYPHIRKAAEDGEYKWEENIPKVRGYSVQRLMNELRANGYYVEFDTKTYCLSINW